MSLIDVFHWLGDSAPGKFLAASTLSFAATQSVHLLGLAGLGGAAIITDLAGVGAIFRKRPPLDLARALLPMFLTALALMGVSGVLLVAAGPMKYYSNPIFPWKILTLGVAVALHLALYPGTTLLKAGAPKTLIRILAGASLIAWISVAILGRWVGLI